MPSIHDKGMFRKQDKLALKLIRNKARNDTGNFKNKLRQSNEVKMKKVDSFQIRFALPIFDISRRQYKWSMLA